jgi:hypothetical protein
MLRSSGRLVVELTSTNPEDPVAIDRASCEALLDQPDVERAGIVTLETFTDVPALGQNTSITAASRTLFPQLDTADVLVGSALREPTGDFHLRMPAGNLALARVLGPQPTGIDTNSTLLVGLPPSTTNGPSCRIVVDGHSDPAEVLPRLAAAVQVSGTSPLTANTPYQETVNPVTTYLERSSRYLPLLIGILGGFAAAVINRVRLSELAAYRLSGTSSRTLALLLALEQFLLAGTLTAAASLVATLLTGTPSIPGLGTYPVSISAVTLAALTAGAAWILTATLLTIDIPLRQPTDLAKDR